MIDKYDVLRQIDESIELKKKIKDTCVDAIIEVADLLISVFKNGNKLLICGNGGSAADSQHIAAEFISSFRSSVKRRSLPAIALTTDTSILTAFTNDFGANGVFARQVEGLGKKGDMLLAISTSGNSLNVVEAVNLAKEKGMKTVGLLGKDGGKLISIVDISLVVSSNDTPRVQEGHVLVYHIICDLVERAFIEVQSEEKNSDDGFSSKVNNF